MAIFFENLAREHCKLGKSSRWDKTSRTMPVLLVHQKWHNIKVPHSSVSVGFKTLLEHRESLLSDTFFGAYSVSDPFHILATARLISTTLRSISNLLLKRCRFPILPSAVDPVRLLPPMMTVLSSVDMLMSFPSTPGISMEIK